MRYWVNGSGAIAVIGALMLAGCGDSGAQLGAAADRKVLPDKAPTSGFVRRAPDPAENSQSGTPSSLPEANLVRRASSVAPPETGGDAVVASRLLGPRFVLTWRPEQRGDGSVTVTVRGADGSHRMAQGASYEAEFSVRDGELRGCALTDPGQGQGEVEAVCSVENGRLILRIGRAHEAGSSMYIELRSVGGNRYEGSVMIRAAVLPTDVRIGNATMQPLLG